MEAPRSAGTGLVVSSDQVREVVRKDDAPSSLGSFSHTLPHAHLHGGNDFERFDLAQLPSLTFAVWGDRGTGWLGCSPSTPATSRPEFRPYVQPLVPENNEILFAISELKVPQRRPCDRLQHPQAQRRRSPEPHRSCVALAGRSSAKSESWASHSSSRRRS